MADFPRLMVLSEKFRGLVFELKEDSVSVGRNDKRDICIKDPSLSSYHCDFIHNEDGFFICDRGSTNGTRLNNVPLEAEQMYPLKSSDLLQLGSVEVMFDFDDGSGPVSTRTETGIDLTSTQTGMSTVKDFTNLSPFARDQKADLRNKKLLIGGIAAAVAAVAALLIWVIVKMVQRLSM